MYDFSESKITRVSLHQQVCQSLTKRILEEEFPVNSFLPNEYDLSRAYRVSIGTIRRAVEQLVACQLVERIQGRGTVVTAHCWADLVKRCNRYQIAGKSVAFGWEFMELEFRTMPAPNEVAEALRMSKGEAVHFTKRVRTAEAGVRLYEMVYFPHKRFPDLSKAAEGKRDATTLARFYGVMIGKLVEDVSAVFGSDEINGLLNVSAGEPLLRTVRVTHDQDGFPVEYRVVFAFLNGGAVRTTL